MCECPSHMIDYSKVTRFKTKFSRTLICGNRLRVTGIMLARGERITKRTKTLIRNVFLSNFVRPIKEIHAREIEITTMQTKDERI